MEGIVLEKNWKMAYIVSVFNSIENSKSYHWFSFTASVHHAGDIITNEVITVKLESCSHTKQTLCLEHEYNILKELQDGTGIPQTIWLGKEGCYQAIILESLGPFLQYLFEQAPKAFNLSFVAKLGLQMVSCIPGSFCACISNQTI